jgi:hypothetical protein
MKRFLPCWRFLFLWYFVPAKSHKSRTRGKIWTAERRRQLAERQAELAARKKELAEKQETVTSAPIIEAEPPVRALKKEAPSPSMAPSIRL